MLPRILAVLLASVVQPATAQPYHLQSPDGSIEVVVHVAPTLAFELVHGGQMVLSVGAGLEVEGRLNPRELPALIEVGRDTVDTAFRPVVREKRDLVTDRYHGLRLQFGGGFAAAFRAYDDGVAYRFETAFPDSITIVGEHMRPRLDPGDSLYLSLVTCRAETDCFHTSFEETYEYLPADELPPNRQAFLPALIRKPGGYVLVTESDLWDYPGMWIRTDSTGEGFEATFAAYPLEETVQGDEFKQRIVARRADYIARSEGTRTFPWRVFMVASRDVELIENDLVYRLARPLEIDDVSWIRPGKATEEWITHRVLYGVDFESGLNTETYRYLIDFAAEYGLEYVMFDAGWSDNDDPGAINPDIDLLYLINYARSKGVGVLLWNLALALERDLESVIDRYQTWGIRGIMVDFMDRDDQKTVRFYERVARAAAERRLLVNFHGAFKPTGMQRAYPNLITREGVLGHEWNMWSDRVTPDHLLTLPFIRMPAGPLDYEGGSMNNGTRDDFRIVFERPMNQGTRTQQLALYVVFESPLQYLSASASDYVREPEFTRVLAEIPTEWDETSVIDGKIGDYLVMARRTGDTWWLAALSDWTPREFQISLEFLPPGNYEALVVEDGPNAHRYAGDYAVRKAAVNSTSTLPAKLAPGGGWLTRIRPQ